MNPNSKNPITLTMWIWSSYIKTALIPVVVIELVFLGVFFSINILMKGQLNKLIYTAVDRQTVSMVGLAASSYDQQLKSASLNADAYAANVSSALQIPAQLSPADAGRLMFAPEGAYYSAADGGAAVYYSGITPVGPSERDKLASVLRLQQLMKDIYEINALVGSVYLTTHDSLRVAYPYFNVEEQYTPGMDFTSLRSYFEADAAHNPEKAGLWTVVYPDAAQQGWMLSYLVPVYNGNILEGVAGIDIPVKRIADRFMQTDIPADSYALLIGSDGEILAVTENGKNDWQLKPAVSAGTDGQEALQDTTTNLYSKPELAGFTADIMSKQSGTSAIKLGDNQMRVAWAAIEETGWKLLIAVPEKSITATIDRVGANVQRIGVGLTAGLIAFAVILLHVLFMRSKKMSKDISQPLVELNNMAFDIGTGNYYQTPPEFNVKELQMTALTIAGMGQSLGDINKNLMSAQKELKDKESYLQAVIHSIDDAIVELDENGAITNLFINDPRKKPSKMSPHFTSIDSIFDKGRAALVLEKLQEVIETGQPATLETEVETVSGTRWAQARLSLVSREPVRVVVTARDITKRKEMEVSILKARDDAEAANRAKSQFLSSMSHELRTPLNAVLGFAQVLELDTSTPLTAIQKECVFEIMSAGHHLLDLINDVLDLARIEAGKTRLSIENVSINAIFEETMTMIIPTGEKYGINVYADRCSCHNRHVKADKIKLKQVLVNLLSNAIKYNKPGGKVEYWCEVVNDKIRFHVADTGIGIAAEDLESIFKPFFRLNKTMNIVEGTGVGLALARQLTEMMGGTVGAESTNGEGSHFWVELPAADDMMLWGQQEEMTARKPERDYSGLSNKKVLCIEDNQANLRLVERVLGLIPGLVFLSAPSAELGIGIAYREKPDVILLDINLPGIDGYEAFLRLRGGEETKHIPVIAVSANAMEREIARAMEMGFADYITKPIKADTFIERIKRVLNR